VLSTKPYLIRALWSWCCDAGLTPYLTLFVDEQCRVPLDYVQNGTITLNLSPAATGALDIGNEWISLSARFGGVSRDMMFPVNAVIGIFARENGAGMEFDYEPSPTADTATPLPQTPGLAAVKPTTDKAAESEKSTAKPAKPHLQLVK
jgi:stringent starvation protein B